MGFLLMTLGESGNFLSYGFAPASLVSPLGAVSLLSNAVVAPTLLGEHLYLLDIAGMVWSDKASATHDKGATGYGVRLLDRFIADLEAS